MQFIDLFFVEFLTLWKCTGTLLCTRILSSPFHRRLAPRGIYIKQRNLMMKKKYRRLCAGARDP